eukprot:4391889-Amphidinium_carterae.1
MGEVPAHRSKVGPPDSTECREAAMTRPDWGTASHAASKFGLTRLPSFCRQGDALSRALQSRYAQQQS